MAKQKNHSGSSIKTMAETLDLKTGLFREDISMKSQIDFSNKELAKNLSDGGLPKKDKIILKSGGMIDNGLTITSERLKDKIAEVKSGIKINELGEEFENKINFLVNNKNEAYIVYKNKGSTLIIISKVNHGRLYTRTRTITINKNGEISGNFSTMSDLLNNNEPEMLGSLFDETRSLNIKEIEKIIEQIYKDITR